MKKCFILFTLSIIFNFISFGQRNEGTFIGTHGNGKIVAFIKNTNGVFIGYFYESKKIYHTLMGVSVNNEVKGQMKLSGLGEYNCEAFFLNDSLLIKVFLNEGDYDHPLLIALKKKNNQTKVNIEKYFSSEKEGYDAILLGEWFLLSDYDVKKQLNIKKEYNSMVLGEKGTCDIIGGMRIDPKISISTKWYTQNKALYLTIDSPNLSLELNEGTYTIQNDTLITRGERHIKKYVKNKL